MRPCEHCRSVSIRGGRRGRASSGARRGVGRSSAGRSLIIPGDMRDRNENERGRVGIVLLILLLLISLAAGSCAAIRMLDRSSPAVTLKSGAKAIGRSARVTIEADEPKWGVRD